MPRLKATSSEAAGALSEREAGTLLWGYPLLDGWQKIHEWQAWLHGPHARALWKRYRSRLINEWLQGLPRDLPVASRLYDSKRQQAELEAMMRAKWAKFERRRPAPPKPADVRTRKAGSVQ
jgi:hypothetical protein